PARTWPCAGRNGRRTQPGTRLSSSRVISRSTRVGRMETTELHDVASVRSGRERFVPRGVATTDHAVASAEGATIWDAEGREYLEFAGRSAGQNIGHNP